MQAGATEDKVRAVAESSTSPLFDEFERAALAYAAHVAAHQPPAVRHAS